MKINLLCKRDLIGLELRDRILNQENQSILIARLKNSTQSQDYNTKLNSDDFSRIRVFRKFTFHGTGGAPDVESRDRAMLIYGYLNSKDTQSFVFQLAGCSWRCWYCYVDYKQLSGNLDTGEFLTTDQMVEIFKKERGNVDILDLSGGQPDLVPEWTLWILKSLEKSNLKGQVHIRSEDNLSNDFIWRFLSKEERRYISLYPNYTRIGCFKGFDNESFHFNTGDDCQMFERQFMIMNSLIQEGFNMYSYVTFTCNDGADMEKRIGKFVDRLQDIDRNLPLRVIPLLIHDFSALKSRKQQITETVKHNEKLALEAWLRCLEFRYTKHERLVPLSEVRLLNCL